MGEKKSLINQTVKFGTNIDIVPSSVHKLNPQFSLCDVDVMYVDDNRNMSNISKEVVIEALYSLYGIPIVGEWLEDEQRFGGHGEVIEIKEDSIEFKVVTKPIGFVTKEAVDNATFIEKPLPNGHEMKTWLHLEKCILWTGRYEEAQSIIEKGTEQSMEVNFSDGFYRDDGYFVATKIVFSALCAIGVEPCFEEAKITRHYAFDEFKKEFSEMMSEYKKMYDTGNTPVQDKNDTNKEGEINMDLTKFASLISDIKYGDDCVKYSLLTANEENIVVVDREDYKLYSVGYAVSEDNVIINWDTKKEVDITYTDKSEDKEVSAFTSIINDLKTEIEANAKKASDADFEAKIQAISEDAEKKLDEFKANYEDLSKSYAVAKDKLDKFEAVEAQRAKEAHIEEVNAELAKFEEKIGKSPEFIYYKAKLDVENADVNTVNRDLTLMTGDILMSKKDSKKSFSYTPIISGIKEFATDNVSDRYGNLLDNWKN